MGKTIEIKFLFDLIAKNFKTFSYPEDDVVVEAWKDILEGYSQTEIKTAFKEYLKNEEYNVPPSPATFKKYLVHEQKLSPTSVEYGKDFNIESQLMANDIAAGVCKYNLPVYRKAVKEIIEVVLPYSTSLEEMRQIDKSSKSPAEALGLKYGLAIKNGLFNDFRAVLEQVAQGNLPVAPTNAKYAGNLLRAHYRDIDNDNDNRFELTYDIGF